MSRQAPVAALVVLLAAAASAAAQDVGPAPQPAPNPPAAKADEPASSPEEVAARMGDLYARVAGDPPALPADKSDPKKVAEYTKAMRAWEDGLEALSKAADAYTKALGGTPGSARTLWWGGYAKARRGDRLGKDESVVERGAAADLLGRALASAPADADFRSDAEFWLGRTQLFLCETGRATPQEAATHLRAAALAFRKAGRAEDAGKAASAALRKLVASDLDAEARAFAAAVDAPTADFGAMTEVVRSLARRAATAVGERFPELADCTDADGKPVAWKELRGKPFVVHFFHAGWPTGRASEQRDVETVLRPLWDRLSPKGLRMVGVSMDLALTREQADRIRANWEEWGIRAKLQDGSRDSVRRFAEDQGVAWPWTWDGLWSKNPVSQALGGCGVNGAHAVLVDAEGVIRWRGDAPFQGLPEAADALVK
jgi:hypothetical protein